MAVDAQERLAGVATTLLEHVAAEATGSGSAGWWPWGLHVRVRRHPPDEHDEAPTTGCAVAAASRERTVGHAPGASLPPGGGWTT